MRSQIFRIHPRILETIRVLDRPLIIFFRVHKIILYFPQNICPLLLKNIIRYIHSISFNHLNLLLNVTLRRGDEIFVDPTCLALVDGLEDSMGGFIISGVAVG